MAAGKILIRLLSFAVPVGIGVAIFVFAVRNSEPPEQAAIAERMKTVRIQTLAARDFAPSVIGYGLVEPIRIWEAVAQVSGRIDFIHPNLRRGSLLKAGTEILRINPKDYELSVRQAEANLESSKARLAELEIQSKNTAKSLEIEQKSLQLSQKDTERKRELISRNTVSQLTLDEAERSLLSQQARVQDLENAMLLYPSQIDAQRQTIDVETTRLESARLDLERTRITLPFNARISQANVEETQYVAVGAVLATADDISGAEIKAEISQDRFRDFATVTMPADFRPPQLSEDTIGKAIEQIGWTAEVRLDMGGQPVTWPARVLRTSDTIDTKTRTVGAIVLVDKPYENVKVGVRPPLVKGMFVEVVMRGRPLADKIVIPRASVRDGSVYVVDNENRLRIRSVSLLTEQGDQAVIKSGLDAGDRLILTDISPAIDGMLVEPVEDDSGSATARSAALQSAPSTTSSDEAPQ